MILVKTQTMKVQNVLITLVDRPAAPDRLSIDTEYIKELAASIAEIGLMSPITLCPRDGRFEIVAGDCRYQAFLSLGRTEIPAFIQELDAQNISIARATENLQRKDLTIIEEARIYKTLHDDHGMGWEKIAKRTGKTISLVKRRYDLLKMPEMLITALHERKITYTVAEVLCGLPDLGRIEYYLGFCIDHGATIAVVRDWVKEEQSRERQKKVDVVGGGWGSALPEMKPVYVACDLCKGPMEIGKEVSLRICVDCHGTIKQNM
jgi:ParB family chromosome partitioning protein